MKKVKKKQLKKILDKIKVYLFYLNRYPQAMIKAPFFLIFYGPKKFIEKINRIEKIAKKPALTNFNFYFLKLFKLLLSPILVYKALKVLFTQGPKKLIEKIKSHSQQINITLNINKQYELWLKKNYPTKEKLKKQKKESKKFKLQPLISLITPVYNPEKKHLIECIESVINQSYENWELCLVDDASTKTYVKEVLNYYRKKDKRIKIKFREKNGHICQASNDALSMAKGKYIALLDHDDFLWPNALYEVVKLINQKPNSQFIYSDEDKIDYDQKTHVDPFFKPDWSPDYLRSINYITHFAVLKKTLVDKIGGFRLGVEGAQDWDLFLRATNWLEKNIGHCHPLDKKNPIQHIQTVLYSWRKTPQSTASEKHTGKVKNYAYENQKKVLKDDLERRGYQGKIEPTEYLGLWKVRYKIIGNPLVSIIIPTKNQYPYIKKCLTSILKKTTYKKYELLIVDTGSIDEKVWKLYKEVKKNHQRTKILKWDKPFNFSSVCNFGAEKSQGKYLLFLNNDTEVITPNWIELMLEHAQRENVGAVGIKLIYPNNMIQHAGIILGLNEGQGITKYPVAGHAFKYFSNGNHGEFFQMMHSIMNYSGVTAACLMIKKNLFFSIEKFDPKLRIAFNDVDLCLKLFNNHYFNIYNGQTTLYHHESISVGKPEKKNRDIKEFKKEIILMWKKWKNLLLNDPYFNKNYSRQDEAFSLDI